MVKKLNKLKRFKKFKRVKAHHVIIFLLAALAPISATVSPIPRELQDQLQEKVISQTQTYENHILASTSSVSDQELIEELKYIDYVLGSLSELSVPSNFSESLKNTTAKLKENNNLKLSSLKIILNRHPIIKFIIGPDYYLLKKINQIIKEDEEAIRLLEKTIEKIEIADNKKKAGEVILMHNKVRLRLENKIKTEADSFSLFGWIFKWHSGYGQ